MGAELSDGSIANIVYKRAEREYWGTFENGICNIDQNNFSFYQYGLASKAGQGDLFILFNSDYGGDIPRSSEGDYFANLPNINDVLGDLENNNGLDSQSEIYIDDFSIDLNFAENLIDRVFADSLPNGRGGAYLEILFFPKGSSSFNKFLFNYGGGNDLYCNVDYYGKHDVEGGMIDSDTSGTISKSRVLEVLNACIPYLEFGFTYENPDNSEPSSPFMGGSYINNASEVSKEKAFSDLILYSRINSLRNKN